MKNLKTLAIRITKKMITTAPNRLTPNNLKYKMAKVKVRKNGDKNPPLMFKRIDALKQSIGLRALGF
ncbi:hypothetical protein HPHPA20_0075 [Helicobacter pylori Hp A-20]|nr:hypothetical protein HPHPA20_0075 [Helicobacter pylori Hp A-20]